jgi:hypothetical protein
MYNILSAKIEFVNNQPSRITLLVEMSKNDVRVIFATTKPQSGYMNIPPAAKISDELLQHVAGYGIEAYSEDEMDIFINWKKNIHRKGEQSRAE